MPFSRVGLSPRARRMERASVDSTFCEENGEDGVWVSDIVIMVLILESCNELQRPQVIIVARFDGE